MTTSQFVISKTLSSRSKSLNVNATPKPAKSSASLQLKHVTRSFGQGSAWLAIDAIPLWSRPNCGESSFSAQAMCEIESIKALRKSVAVKCSVAVAAYEAADA